MLFGRGVQVLSACICILSSPVRADDVSLAVETIETIRQQLLARKVERIDVLRISDEVFTVIPISPGDFERYPHQQYALRLADRDSAELAAALEKLKLTQLPEPPDLRWEVVFLDGSGGRLHSIFLDKAYWYGKGRKGYVDGHMCGFSPGLIGWLEKRLSASLNPSPL
jgi:hypothetical protein